MSILCNMRAKRGNLNPEARRPRRPGGGVGGLLRPPRVLPLSSPQGGVGGLLRPPPVLPLSSPCLFM